MTRRAPCTRSIAPPMPLTILPGIIQLARSPRGRDLHRAEDRGVDVAAADHPEATCAESKNDAPGRIVTVSLPALIRSGSTSSSSAGRARRRGCRSRTAARRATPSRQVVRAPASAGRCRGSRTGRRASSRGGAGGHLVAGQRHRQASLRVSVPSRARRCASRSACRGLLGGRARRRAARRCRAGGRVGVELARLDELLDLGDGDPAGHRGQRVEVAGRRRGRPGCRAGRRPPRAPARSRW